MNEQALVIKIIRSISLVFQYSYMLLCFLVMWIISVYAN